ncbi:MAG TPA: SpoIIE family protein phosphatase, partial [Candidatus Omnitrophota bacterium]|nr:SpoIIE family protein phosphatase [Candidatus Omnitrophota bacterium]
YPGVGVHASLYNGLMNNSFIIRLDRIWNIVALVFLWILTGAIAVRAHRKKAFIYVFVAIAGYLIFSIALFSFFGVWIDMFYPVTSAICVYGVLTFQRYLDETRKRELLEKELNIAKNIQQSFLPVEIPKTGGLDIAVEMKTARQVGGDLYDIVELDNEKLGVMIGDVSGKGVPAALFMAKVVSVFKSFVKGGACNEVVKSVNERLIIESNSNLFVTLTYMIFDTAKRTVSFSIGGHLPTIVVSRDGNVRIFAGEEGTPLGLMEGDFSREEFTYDEGDLILLYTDGVTEAMTVRNEMFEEKRLIDLAKTLTGRSAAEVVTAIHKKITEFAGKAEQHDDITVLAIRT